MSTCFQSSVPTFWNTQYREAISCRINLQKTNRFQATVLILIFIRSWVVEGENEKVVNERLLSGFCMQ